MRTEFFVGSTPGGCGTACCRPVAPQAPFGTIEPTGHTDAGYPLYDIHVLDQVDVNRVVRAMLSLAIGLTRWYRLDGSDHPRNWASSTRSWH